MDQRGTCDRIFGFAGECRHESWFCFDRIGGKPHFGEDELELGAFALRGVGGATAS